MEQKWYHIPSSGDSEFVKIYNLLKTLGRDFKNSRYLYLESFLRNIPGELGVYLRYHFIARRFQSVGKDVIIAPGNRFQFPKRMEVGDNVLIGFNGQFQAMAGIQVGDRTMLAQNVMVWTVNHLYADKDKQIRLQGFEACPVVIGADCWIASNVFIKPGTCIPDGCVVFANSVVGGRNFPPYSAIGGNPAKVLGPRERIGAFVKFKKTPTDSVES